MNKVASAHLSVSCVRTNEHELAQMHTRTHACTHTHAHARTHTHTHIDTTHTHKTHTHTHKTHAHLCHTTHSHVYIHVHIHAHIHRVGQNHIRCINGIIGRDITKYTVIHLRFCQPYILMSTHITRRLRPPTCSSQARPSAMCTRATLPRALSRVTSPPLRS